MLREVRRTSLRWMSNKRTLDEPSCGVELVIPCGKFSSSGKQAETKVGGWRKVHVYRSAKTCATYFQVKSRQTCDIRSVTMCCASEVAFSFVREQSCLQIVVEPSSTKLLQRRYPATYLLNLPMLNLFSPIGVTGRLTSLLNRATLSLNATYSLSAYPMMSAI